MNASITRLVSTLALSLALISFVATVKGDPLPGRDIKKFSQLPMVNTPIQDPVVGPNPNFAPGINGVTLYGGHDELSTVYGFHGSQATDIPQTYQGRFMADDFADKLTSPVVHIKWWGSYLGDHIVEPLNQFLIAFEADQPVDANNPFSHPSQPLLTQVVNRAATLTPGSGTFTEKLVRGPDPVKHESLFEYNAELHLDKAFPEKADTVYWLKIAAMIDTYPGFSNFDLYNPTGSIFFGDRPTVWGWHNRDYTVQDALASPLVAPGEVLDGTINGAPIYHFQDDAVTGRMIVNMVGPGGRVMPSVSQTNMSPTFYVDGADGPAATAGAVGISHYSKDLAFELYTTNVPEPSACLILICGSAGLLLTKSRSSR